MLLTAGVGPLAGSSTVDLRVQPLKPAPLDVTVISKLGIPAGLFGTKELCAVL